MLTCYLFFIAKTHALNLDWRTSFGQDVNPNIVLQKTHTNLHEHRLEGRHLCFPAPVNMFFISSFSRPLFHFSLTISQRSLLYCPIVIQTYLTE